MSLRDLQLTPVHGSGTITPGARFLVVFDVDSTLIENEVIDLVAAHAGVAAEVAAVTERAMRGELDFAESLRARVALLRGLPLATAVDVDVQVTRGVPEVIAAVHAAGGRVGAVSGGFHEVLDGLAARLGLDVWRANRFGVAPRGSSTTIQRWNAPQGIPTPDSGGTGGDSSVPPETGVETLPRASQPQNLVEPTASASGASCPPALDEVLTGEVSGPIIGRAEKQRTVRSWAQSFALPLERVIVVGDGANDLDMMSSAGLSVAFAAKPLVREQAAVCIPDRDMRALLAILPRPS